jgi:ATP-dependent helicase/nuclease subunit B
VRLLFGPAGSGKTSRCLAELGGALCKSPEGLPLILVAPKQTTYQLERQLLANPAISGYTRLHILSFERLGRYIFDLLGQPPPEMLTEEGRVMVLRALLARKRKDLKLFRASARLSGFAQQLSGVLGELQRHQLTPELLNQVATRVSEVEGLAFKLQDLATLLGDYLGWLKAHNLQHGDCVLAAAAEQLTRSPASFVRSTPELRKSNLLRQKHSGGQEVRSPKPTGMGRQAELWENEQGNTQENRPRIEGLWVDGFAELTPQELELLAGLMTHCGQATLTFCLEALPSKNSSWLSNWSVVQRTFEKCKERLEQVPGATVVTERLEREPNGSRFGNNPVLRHLEEFWAESKIYAGPEGELEASLRVASCANPEAEATLAAREVLRYVRAGGRYREVTVLVRKLERYHQPLQRVFSRYEIPFFLDRRESVSHHPMAELTREALRTVTFRWQHQDFFATLKTGLVDAEEEEIDWLENEALARGWKGEVWNEALIVNGDEGLTRRLAGLQKRILTPFQKLAFALGQKEGKHSSHGAADRNVRASVAGSQLAAALREFWEALKVREHLENWAAGEISNSELRIPNPVHATVWDQMNRWLDNVELAFGEEALSLREWLPILEAGLAGLTVGVIPPALDQVLIGAVDRSRNPDVKLALVLGLNETIFPASPQQSVLLTETDRAELARRNVALSAGAREQLSRERYLAYIACTRSRERLVLTCALHDANGAVLNPSPFLAQLRKLFPGLKSETAGGTLDWRESEHVNELIGPMLRARGQRAVGKGWDQLARLPAVASALEQVRQQFQSPQVEEILSPGLASRLYGPLLRTSVSRIEQFAACPFKFFIHSGLRAEDRKLFELDVKEQGNFQHEALARFHQELVRENKRWRDIEPEEGRSRIRDIAEELIGSYREGLLQSSAATQFSGRVMTESLQDFVEILVGWMREQYGFDPVEVELSFGEEENSPAWEMVVENGNRLALHGRIDRVDLWREKGSEEALCVVMDYKSSHKRLDPVLMENGLQLQLLAYLAVLRHWPKPGKQFGAKRLIPAGVFYVNLRGKFNQAANRRAALADSEARKLAYKHTGRFDSSVLRRLDSRGEALTGDQFNYRLTKSGELYRSCREPLDKARFEALLDSVEENLKEMGGKIFAGEVAVAPYRRGTATACDQCDYGAICRIDRWTHSFRLLKGREQEAGRSERRGE